MNTPAHNHAVLALTVNNHPGVMSHVCGLFSRRSFNLEGILCAPQEGGSTSRMWLLVGEDRRLDQVERQLDKLHDVLEVRRDQVSPQDWGRLRNTFQAAG